MDEKFKKILLEYKKKIDKGVSLFFQNKILTGDTFEQQYLKILKEYSLRPAKRLRAILVNVGYLLAGGKNTKEILRTSIFIEVIHNFLLIHDDIIDRDEFRRGKESIHCYYRNKSFLNGQEGEHFGKSMAIVLGDIANNLGYEIIINSGFNEQKKIRAFKKLNEIIELTGKGQILEICLKEKMRAGNKINEKDIIDVYRFKTAFYTFILPLQIGAILAGANNSFLRKIEKFALPLGIAFQIRDDLKEIFEPENDLGKPIMSDIRESQPNLLIVKTLEKDKKINDYLGRKKINKNEAEIIRKLIIESGSLQYCKNMGLSLSEQAQKVVSLEKHFPKEEGQFIINLIEYLNR